MIISKILLLIVLSAFISYIGDHIGYRIGKKKLTLFGLRPKKSARLITILTGIFITIITLSFASLISKDVRFALFNDVEKLKEEKKSLIKFKYDLNGKIDQLSSKIKNLNSEIAENKISLERYKFENNKQLFSLEKLYSERKNMVSEKKLLAKENIELTVANENTRKEIEKYKDLEKELKSETKKLEIQFEILNLEKKRLEKANRILADDFNLLKTERDNLITRKKTLEDSFNELNKRFDSLKFEKDSVNQKVNILEEKEKLLKLSYNKLLLQNEEMKKEKDDISFKLEELHEKEDELYISVKGLKLQSDQLTKKLKYYENLNNEKSKSNMLYSINSVINTKVIFGYEAKQIVKQRLYKLILDSINMLEVKGVKIKELSKYIKGNERIVNSLVNRIVKDSKKSWIIKFKTVENLFANQEFSHFKFDIVERTKIYSKQESIHDDVINGKLSRIEILHKLENLLSKMNSKFSNMASYPKDWFANITSAKFLKLVDKIKDNGKRVKVKIVAIKDIYFDGPFKFKIVTEFNGN